MGPMTSLEVVGVCDDKLEMGAAFALPVMVRLEALATWTRMAGRATLTVEAAMDEARREARTRVEAISTDGEERDDKKEKLLMDGKDW